MTQQLSMFQLGGRRSILAGAPRGKAVLGKLITAAQTANYPRPIFLTFRNVNVATSSFLREAVLGFRDYCTTIERSLYPVVADANDVIKDELEFLLKLYGDALVICDLGVKGKPITGRVIGHLNDKECVTLTAIIAAGEADAAMLVANDRTDKIKITGWNNRLASLAAKGIVMEFKKGRSKLYRPILEKYDGC